MFEFKRQPSPLDEPITKVLTEMDEVGPTAPEYKELLESLEKLHALKAEEKSPRRVSPDTIAMVLGNLACVLTIVAYEQKHVMASKAMAFVTRLTNRHS